MGAEDSKMIRDYMSKKGLNTKINLMKRDRAHPMYAATGGAWYHPYEPSANTMFKDPALLMHELGHANYYKHLGKNMGMLRMPGMLGGMIASMGLGASSDPDVSKYAPAAVLAGMTPTLIDEGYATGSALKHIHGVQGRAGVLRALKTLGPAGLSYLAQAAIPAAAMAWYGNRER
jgi:hypothetical protein